MTTVTTPTTTTPDENLIDVTNEQPATPEPVKRLRATVNRDVLDAALKDVLYGVSSKATIPVLSTIQITRDAGGLYLRTTNLEVGIARDVEVDDRFGQDAYGAVCIPARKLAQFIAGLAKGDVLTLTQTAENALKIEGKRSRSRATIVGLGTEDFPVVPVHLSDLVQRDIENAQRMYESQIDFWKRHPSSIPEPVKPSTDIVDAMAAIQTVSIPVGQLKNAIKQVSYCAATDDARPVFTSVLLENRDGRLALVGADSFRLGIYSFEVAGLGDPVAWQPLLVPSKTLDTLAKLLAKTTSGTVLISIPQSRQQILFTVKGLNLLSNTQAGQFPNYTAIVQHDQTTTVELMRADLEAAIKRATQFAKDAANVTTFTISPKGTLTVGATDDDEGKTEQDMDATVAYKAYHEDDPTNMPDTSFHLNCLYVRQFVDRCPTARLRLTLRANKQGGVATPLTFTPIPNDDEKLGYQLSYIAMPMFSNR